MAKQDLMLLESDARIDAAATRLSMTRRECLQFCAGLTTTLGLPQGADAAIAEAVATKKRPSVIWLHFQECTGCTESLLRAEHPTLEKLILDVISLDYHETLFAAAGHQVEAARLQAMSENKGQYVLVVEGAIPTKDGGIYCKIGGQTAIDMVKECAADAAAVTDDDPNSHSIVGLLEWRRFRMLLTGDAEAGMAPLDPGPLDVLKVAHHGSDDTGLPGLLARTSPRLAVIPVGEGKEDDETDCRK